VLVRNAQEALAYATAALAGWARGSPLAEKWDDAASDAIEDLIVAGYAESSRAAAAAAVFGEERVYAVLRKVVSFKFLVLSKAFTEQREGAGWQLRFRCRH